MKMKYSVFTVMTPEFTPEQLVNKLAGMGYEGVEWRVATVLEKDERKPSFWGNNRCTLSLQTLKEKTQYFKEIARKKDLECCNLATYLGVDQLERIEIAMQAAKSMQCSQIRIKTPSYQRGEDYNSLFKGTQKKLQEVEKIASKYDIKVLLELHPGNMMPSASAAYRLISLFDPRYIAVIYDPGNMIQEGYENWLMGMQLLRNYLAHVHIKNCRWVIDDKNEQANLLWRTVPVRLEKGIVNWKQVMTDLKTVGYEGYLSFEDFSDIPTEEKLSENIKYLKSLE